MGKLRIIIDTREQTPWAFPELEVFPIRGCLRAGDYALQGDDKFAIERKNLDDFLGTISSGWERFQRELDRMRDMDFPARVIIVEGDFIRCCFTEESGKIEAPKNNHPRLTPQFIVSRIAELTLA
ncbi:MAG: ERCC4 domain-containing protein, partial [Victivallaceae bacterium]|nr:ERCC4 domain-containing protein [Victivallaceae bacterium]